MNENVLTEEKCVKKSLKILRFFSHFEEQQHFSAHITAFSLEASLQKKNVQALHLGWLRIDAKAIFLLCSVQ